MYHNKYWDPHVHILWIWTQNQKEDFYLTDFNHSTLNDLEFWYEIASDRMFTGSEHYLCDVL